ncbi:MAG: hypothetical protein CML16_03300 [Pusillimonas sp.]|nr:hypothetical protein [Pusillimonas sp.]MBC43614.1 hypothetical protein [Pusillimonas sp.]HCP79384.1 hypothetical protein [Pusillimonas sp.]|tara:strand:+ start:308 stop:742 length:435 start_codon:yes stop_codon:yes gene_type:complete
MTQEIKLPPLPTITVDGKEYKQVWFTAHEVEKLRVAAVEADRQARGEPVAWKELALESIKRMRAGHVGCQDILMKSESLLGSEQDPQPQQIPNSLAQEAAKHLTSWLDMDSCECEGIGHSCGRTEVKNCRDRLLEAAPEPKEKV